MEWLNKQLGNLAIKMTGYVLGIVILIFGISGYIELKMAYNTAVEESRSEAESAMETAIKAVDWRLQNVEHTTQTAALFTFEIESNPDACYEYLMKIVEMNPDIATAGIMFVPDYFASHKGLYAPRVYHNLTTDQYIMNDISSEVEGYLYTDADNYKKRSMARQCGMNHIMTRSLPTVRSLPLLCRFMTVEANLWVLSVQRSTYSGYGSCLMT